MPNDARIKVVQRRILGLTRVLESQGPSLAPHLPKLLPGQATQLDDPAIESALISAGEKQTAAIVPQKILSETAEKSWHVQLASFRASEAADQEIKRLRKSFESLFTPAGGLQIVQARLPKGVFHRLDVGPIPDRAAAGTLCRTLKARGQACIVVRR